MAPPRKHYPDRKVEKLSKEWWRPLYDEKPFTPCKHMGYNISDAKRAIAGGKGQRKSHPAKITLPTLKF